MPTASKSSAIRKTHSMILTEKANGGRDIRDLILDAIRTTDRDQDAAHRLNIYPSTLSHWIPKLGIKDQVDEAREERNARKSA